MYDELLSNYDEDMIAQPLLSTYFNLVYDDILIQTIMNLLKFTDKSRDV